MILVPATITILIGLLCVGFIWFSLVHGFGFGVNDREDFDRACAVISEAAEKSLKNQGELSLLEPLLDSSRMSMAIFENGQNIYTYGAEQEADGLLLDAAAALGNEASITHNGRSLFAHNVTMNSKAYQIFLFGGSSAAADYATLKVTVVLCEILIAFGIFLSILLTNRFLTKFVFQRIEQPLDILTDGVHQLRDGNLDFRITYERQDEFLPICEDFNEMALRLKESVQEIQQQERSRKMLIAGISHDIRSPLTSIQAYVEGLLDGIAKTPEAQKRYLTTIKTKAEDLEHIVSQLFLFSKMELGEYPENPCRLRLDESIRETVSALEAEYRQQGLSIAMALEPVTICADPVQIQRIVTNILQNSLKYKDKAQGNLRISLCQGVNDCELTFADDGPGVPAEALPHLFEVFYRSDPARQNPNKGSGLGLAIVANAVQRMGGSITAAPSELGGLEIRILIPNGGTEHGQNSDH